MNEHSPFAALKDLRASLIARGRSRGRRVACVAIRGEARAASRPREARSGRYAAIARPSPRSKAGAAVAATPPEGS